MATSSAPAPPTRIAMRFSRFSQEIVDYILDYLHNDVRALRICALTCRSWLRTSQLHLFFTIPLVKSQPGASFISLITESPHLAKYVRLLYLAETTEDRWLDSPIHGLRALAPALPRVLDLTLKGVSWATLSSETLHCLQDGCRVVRTLRVDTCDFPSPASFARALAMFRRLQTLRIFFCKIGQPSQGGDSEESIASPAADETFDVAPRATLINLSFVSDAKSSPPMSILLDAFDFRELKRLTAFGGLDRIAPFVNEVCRSAGASLTCLTVSDYFNADDNFARLDLGPVPNLATFNLDAMITPATVPKAMFLFSDIVKTAPLTALKRIRYRAIVPLADCLQSWDWDSIRSAHNAKAGLASARLELLVMGAALDNVRAAHCGTFGKLMIEAKAVENAHITQEI